jgi:hypothetical protein
VLQDPGHQTQVRSGTTQQPFKSGWHRLHSGVQGVHGTDVKGTAHDDPEVDFAGIVTKELDKRKPGISDTCKYERTSLQSPLRTSLRTQSHESTSFAHCLVSSARR